MTGRVRSKSESWAVQSLQFYVGNFKAPVYRSLNRDARMDNEKVELLIKKNSILTVSRKKHSSVIVVITMEM